MTAPVVGATKLYHAEGAAKAACLMHSDEELWSGGALCPHAAVGVMEQNTAAVGKYFWSEYIQQIGNEVEK